MGDMYNRCLSLPRMVEKIVAAGSESRSVTSLDDWQSKSMNRQAIFVPIVSFSIFSSQNAVLRRLQTSLAHVDVV